MCFIYPPKKTRLARRGLLNVWRFDPLMKADKGSDLEAAATLCPLRTKLEPSLIRTCLCDVAINKMFGH